jgi:hypothetical protein
MRGGAHHPQAKMAADEAKQWLTAPIDEALELQRPGARTLNESFAIFSARCTPDPH